MKCWIDPNGKKYILNDQQQHRDFAQQHLNLNIYDANGEAAMDYEQINEKLVSKGWVRFGQHHDNKSRYRQFVLSKISRRAWISLKGLLTQRIKIGKQIMVDVYTNMWRNYTASNNIEAAQFFRLVQQTLQSKNENVKIRIKKSVLNQMVKQILNKKRTR